MTEGRALETEASLAASLARSELRFRLAFQGSMAPMVFSDREGLFLAVNSAFCKMCGRSEDELIGRDSKQFTYPEDIGLSEEVNRLIRTGEIEEYRYGSDSCIRTDES